MTKSYKGKNGIIRDAIKLWDEMLIVIRGLRPHFNKDFFSRPFHAITNIFVEALRLSPYFWGHMLILYIVLRIVFFMIPG